MGRMVAVGLVVPLWVAAVAYGASNDSNAQAIEEIKSGARTDANATWWGFNEEDSSEALQSAINSGAKRVVKQSHAENRRSEVT